MIREAMHNAKAWVEMISQLTLGLALLPAILYGGWLSLGRPFDESDQDRPRENGRQE